MNKKKKVLFIVILVVAIVLLTGVTIFLLTREKEGPYNVVFQDFDGKILKTETVKVGEGATAPEVPGREGYTFFEWNKDYTEITEDVIVKAEYVNNTETTFVVDKATVDPETLEAKVAVSVQNNPGILGMVLSVEYDDKALTLLKAESGNALSTLTFQEPSRFADGCNFVWYGSETGEVQDGELLVLTFKVATDVETKEYPITVKWNERDIYDANCDMLLPKLVAGSVTITN